MIKFIEVLQRSFRTPEEGKKVAERVGLRTVSAEKRIIPDRYDVLTHAMICYKFNCLFGRTLTCRAEEVPHFARQVVEEICEEVYDEVRRELYELEYLVMGQESRHLIAEKFATIRKMMRP